MGDARRSDADREQRQEQAPAPKVAADEHEEGTQFGEIGMFEPEHKFAGVGDQDEVWARFERSLASSSAAVELPTIVADMDRGHRDRVKDRLGDVAKVATGDVVLQVGDLVLAGGSKTIRAALHAASLPGVARLRSYLSALAVGDLELLDQDGTITALRAAYPGPVGQLVPQIADLSYSVLRSKALLRWYVDSTPPATVAMQLLREAWSEAVGDGLNELGAPGWAWALHTSPTIAAANPSGVADCAAQTNQADVRTHLQRLVESAPAAAADASSLDALLAKPTFDMKAVLAAAAAANTAAGATLERHRKVLIKHAAFDELMLITHSAYLTPDEEAGWWLDSPHVTADGFRDGCAIWPTGLIEMFDAKLVERIAAKFPSTTPVELFGTRCAPIYRLAAGHAKIRQWCARHAEPLDRLRLLTETPDQTRTLWTKLVADGIDPAWVNELGPGEDVRLRILAANCPDPAIAQSIQTRFLGDAYRPESLSNTVAAEDPALTAKPRERLDGAMDDGSAAELLRRVREMSAAERGALQKDGARVEELVGRMDAATLPGLLVALDPPLATVLRYLPDGASVLAYLRTRSDDEVVAALSDPKAAKAAIRNLGVPPLTAFPMLTEPANLKKLIKDHPLVLEWILRETDASHALLLLGDPKVAKTTASMLEDHIDLLRYIPPGNLLPPAAKEALERIGVKADDSRIEDRAAGEEESSDLAPGIGDRAALLLEARRQADLTSALTLVLGPKGKKGGDQAAVLEICRERATEAKSLLTDDAHDALVEKLHHFVGVSPLAVFPGVSYLLLLHGQAARRWLFETEPPQILLAAIAEDAKVVALIAKHLDAADPGVMSLLQGLPRGSALSSHERAIVKELFELSKRGAAARVLFGIRFDAEIADTFTHKELGRMWPILERLPDAHAAEGAVNSYIEPDMAALGLYNQQQIRLKEDGMDQPVEKEDLYDTGLPLTKEQIQKSFEIDEATFTKQLADGRFAEVPSDEGVRYKVVAPKVELLTHTLLHEVGHAVDDMLGQQTELVYGIGGWRRYGEVDFEAMVADLGGWGSVTAQDQISIRDAWLSWLNGKSTAQHGLDALVGADHAALADKYAGTGIVDLARKRQPMSITKPLVLRGRAWISNENWGQFYSVPERTLYAAPSIYGMTAPPEYFAECYADYYRDYDGSPQTEGKKGGNLAPWIKQWFDVHIDRIGFNPKRP